MELPTRTPVVAEAWLLLSRAMLCLDEEHIFDLALGPRCPGCDSEHVVSLAAWLGTTAG